MRSCQAALVVFAATLLGAGCGSSSSEKLLLRLKAKEGDAYSVEYVTVSSLEKDEKGAGDESKLVIVRQFTCTGAEGDKTKWNMKTLEAEGSGSGEMSASAQAAAMAEKQKVEDFIRDERNQIIDEPKASFIEVEFPIQAVGVGDAWRSELLINGRKVLMKYKLDGIEALDGRKAAVIEGTMEEGTGVVLLGPVRIWIDSATGWLLKADSAFEQTIQDNMTLRLEHSARRK